MVSFTIASGYAVVFAILFPATIAQPSDSVPPCLYRCLQQTTQPCTTSSLPALISCINTQCASSLSTPGISAASMALTYTPKAEYSCQQSFVPGSSEGAPSMQLTGDGTCTTSPYDFQSLFVSTAADDSGEDDDGAMTLQKMARQCEMTLYSDESCEGQETKLDLNGVQGDKCIFQGGRSAKLVCNAMSVPDTPSYSSILSSLCRNSSNPNPANQPNGTWPAANSTSTTSPYGGIGGPSNTTSPAASTVSTVPYTGRASGDQVAKPSLIALVALFAVAVLLL